MKTKLKQVIIATINSSDLDTREVLRDVSNLLLSEYTVTQLLDTLLSHDVVKSSSKFIGEIFSVAVDSDSSVLPKDKEKEAFKLFDALNLFWLHVLEDYSSDDLDTYLNVVFDIYCDSLSVRKMSVTKVTRERMKYIMKSPVCKALIIMCIFSVDIGAILARGESPIKKEKIEGKTNE